MNSPIELSSCPPLEHLDRLTDPTGLIQHAIYCIPRRESGYTTDDNARALRLCARLYDEHPDGRMLERVTCYLSFMEHAGREDGGFHNFMSFQRHWLDRTGCGDSQGQAVLALAEVLGSELPQGYRDLARELIERAMPVLASLTSLRAHAYVVQAWASLSRDKVTHIGSLEEIAKNSVKRLVDAWKHTHRPSWPWFEPQMTYANAILPHAMFDAAERWANKDFLSIAKQSFAFLDETTTTDDVFWPVGNDGWNSEHTEKSLYDQQPVEASTMAAAAMAALQCGHDQRYVDSFQRAHGWFYGQNSLLYPMADENTGGCLDGLEAKGVNRNQGAESTLAYLWTEVLSVELHGDATLLPDEDSSSGTTLKLHDASNVQ